MDRNKLIQAIMQGDVTTLENAMPIRMVDCYQIDGQDAVFRMDGTKLPADELSTLECSKSFLTIKTYLSHDEVPA